MMKLFYNTCGSLKVYQKKGRKIRVSHDILHHFCLKIGWLQLWANIRNFYYKSACILSILIITAHCSIISNSFLHLLLLLLCKGINGPFNDFLLLFVTRLRHSVPMVRYSSVSFMSVIEFALFSLLHFEYLPVFFFSPSPDF